MRDSKTPSETPNSIRKNIWAAQPSKEMELSPFRKLAAILGMVTSGKPTSNRESWLSRKYMGVWSLESVWIRKSRMALPRRPVVNVAATRENRTRCGPEWPKSPMRVKSEVTD